MRNLLLLISINFRTTFRKKGNIFVHIFLPLAGVLLSMMIYGNSFGGAALSDLKIGIVDYDKSMASTKLREKFDTVDSFSIFDVNEDEINNKLLDFKLDAAVIIPENYSESIIKGDADAIEIVSLKGQETTIWIEQLINRYTSSMMMLSGASGGDAAVFERMREQTEESTVKLDVINVDDKGTSKSMTMTSVGFLIMFMMLGTGLTSMLILNDKRNRTYHRICSAPVNAGQYILANSLTSLFISVIQIILILFAMKVIFRIDTGVSDIYMFIILFMYALVAVGLGLLITAFSSSSYMAGTLNTLILTPTCMLGGCYWDISLMPDYMQKISYFVPQRWAIMAVNRMQTGASFGEISFNLLVLAVFALALILVAVYKFSRTNNVQRFV